MHLLLHSPRSRKRGIGAATALVVALVASLLTITPVQAFTDTGTGGVFVPASGRILDTQSGTGGYSTPMPAGTYRTIKVAGLAGLPDDGTVGAVSLNATAAGSSGYGTLYGRPDADTARTQMLIYSGIKGEFTSNTATIAVGADGTIQVMTENNARLILDVQGYYTASDSGTAPGGFVPITGKRIADTRSGTGVPQATIAAGKSVDIQVGGKNGVPANASGAVLNLVAINSTTSDGYLTPYASGSTRPSNALHYAPQSTTSMQTQVSLSSTGKVTIYNGSTSAELVVDLQGYFTAAGQGGAVFTPGAGRVFNSRSSDAPTLARGETRAIQVAGKAGVPVMGSGITAVVLTLTVWHGGANGGYARVWPSGVTEPITSSINFDDDEIRTNTITVALGANGKINLHNITDATDYSLDIQGWYANLQVPTITCGNPYQAGAWPDAAEGPNGEALNASCTIVAPPASTTGQSVEVDNNAGDEAGFDLSNAIATTQSVTVQVQPGRNLIEAYLVSPGGTEGPHTSIAFGVGNWTTATLAPLVPDGSTTYRNVVLGSNPSTGDGYPEDASFKFWLKDDTTGAIVLDESSNSGMIAVDETMLLPNHEYSWKQTIHGTLRWDELSTRTSQIWKFTTASDGNQAEHDPSVGDTESQTHSVPTPESVAEEANQESTVPYGENSEQSEGGFSTFGIKFGPCWFYPSGTWLRASSGYQNLGSKPRAECSKTMAKISFTSHPVRKNYVFVIETGSTEFWPAQTNTAYNTKKYTDKKLGYECLNQSGGKHFWYFKTMSSALSKGGTWYYASGNSKIEFKQCSEV